MEGRAGSVKPGRALNSSLDVDLQVDKGGLFDGKEIDLLNLCSNAIMISLTALDISRRRDLPPNSPKSCLNFSSLNFSKSSTDPI